jgi:PAS domain S-box-containing protein
VWCVTGVLTVPAGVAQVDLVTADADATLHRQPGAWKQYQSLIIGGSLITILQSAFIVALLVQRTRRKRAEQALRESEERFRLMADTAPVLVWRSGTDKQCDFVNRPWLEFTGRTVAQELGNGWSESICPDDLDRFLRTYASAFDAREPFHMEYRVRRSDGVYRWIVNTGVARYGPDGSFAGYIGSCLDITDRKDSEDALQSQQRYAWRPPPAPWRLGLELRTSKLYVIYAEIALGVEDAEITDRPEDWGSRYPKACRQRQLVKACIDGEADVYK